MVLALSFSTLAASAQDPAPETRVCETLPSPAELRPGDLFGCALDAAGPIAVVGSVLDDSAGRDAGALYVYRRGAGFEQEAFFSAAGVGPGDRLGYAVATDGGRVLAGAPFHDAEARDGGGAWLFARGEAGWFEEAKLAVGAFGGGLGVADQLGYAVAIDGGVAVLGAPGDDDGGDAAGAVYVFFNGQQGWQPVAKLTASDAAVGDGFGSSVAVSGGTILVGAPYRDGPGREAGAVYLFAPGEGLTWNEVARVTGGGGGGALFGHAVDLDAGRVLVGARSEDGEGANAGAAYLYRRAGAGLVLEQRLSVPRAAGDLEVGGDEFGISVALGDDRLLVGARFDDDTAADSGAVYLFRRQADGVWRATDKLKLEQPGVADELGYAVALAGDAVFAGAYLDDDTGTDAGVACLFSECPFNPDCPGTQLPFPDCSCPETGSDLAVSCTPPPSFTPSTRTATWSLRVTNRGPEANPGAGFGVIAPPGTICTPPPGGSCTAVPPLASGGSVVYTLSNASVVPVCRGFLSLSATGRVTPPADPRDPNPGNDVATCVVSPPPTNYDLAVTYTAQRTAGGSPLTYMVEVSNEGSAPANGVVLRVDAAPGSPFVPTAVDPSCNGGGPGATCSLGTLAPGDPPLVLTFTYAADLCTIPESQQIQVGHAVSVSGTLMCETEPSDDAAAAQPVTVGNPGSPPCPDEADVSVEKEGPPTAVLGVPYEYTVTLRNNGTSPATDVLVVDDLPDELTNPQWSCTASPGAVCPPLPQLPETDLDARVPLIPPGGTVTLTVGGTPFGPCGPGQEVINTAALPEIDDGRSSAVTTVLVPPGGICATKIVAFGLPQEGSEITYLVTLFNGNGFPIPDGAGPEFTDTLPPSLALIGASASSGVVMTMANTVTWNGSIPAGGTVEISITAIIDAGTTGNVICNQGQLVPTGTRTDDPNEPGLEDPTCFLVTFNVPTLGPAAFALLALLLALAGWALLRRRRRPV